MYGASRRNILIASGALRDSYVQKNKDHVERISKERLIIGSKHTIAPFHEFGTGVEGPKQRAFLIQAKNAKALKFMGPRGVVFAKSVMNPGVPKRPVTNLPDEEIDKVVEVLTRYFYEGKSK
jgi:phage gpG-like protein